MAGRTAKRKLTLDCLICGEPVVLAPERFVELVKAGRRPVCRRNGCYRLCGPQDDREQDCAVRLDIATEVSKSPRPKRGNVNGAIAKHDVARRVDWRYEDV